MAKAASLPKRFKCSKCVKRFTRAADGHRHFETIHAVSLVYLCPECDHDSPLKKNCERHIEAYHPGKGAKPIGFFLCEDDKRRGEHHGVPRKDRVVKLGDREDEEDEEDSDEEDEEEAEEDAEEEQGEQVTPPPVAGPSGAASMDLPVSGMRPAPANSVPLGVFALQIVPCNTARASPYQNAHAARGWTIKARNAGWTQKEFNERLAAELKFVRETGQVPALFEFEPLDVNWKIPLPPPAFPPGPQGPVSPTFNQAPPQVPAYPHIAASAPPRGFAPMQGTYQQAAPAFQGAAIQGPAFPADLRVPPMNARFDGGQQSQTLPFWNEPPPPGSFAELMKDIPYPSGI